MVMVGIYPGNIVTNARGVLDTLSHCSVQRKMSTEQLIVVSLDIILCFHTFLSLLFHLSSPVSFDDFEIVFIAIQYLTHCF